MESRIREAVEGALAELGAGEVAFAVEWPAELSHGDFATNAALAAAKSLGKAPKEIAETLRDALEESLGTDASKVEVAGPGFVNITLSQSAVIEALKDTESEVWGTNDMQSGKRVMVEYGNPNPFKEMHIGHMMGAVVGESVARIIESAGATVIRDTFGGDVGPHVAKTLWALRRKGVTDIGNAREIGEAYLSGATAYEESAEAKEEIDALNVRIYELMEKQGKAEELSEDDRSILSLWRKGREVSMEEHMRVFGLLGTHHDYVFYDSDTTDGGMRIVMESLEKGIFERSEGAVIYKGEKKGLHTLVFITSRGAPLYPTKDIGLAFLKEERVESDENIIVTAIEQIGHFKVTLAALEDIAPMLAEKTRHIAHGLLQLTTGKMASRKGNIITASDLIQDILKKAGERNEDPIVAHQVAIGAIKYMVLRQAPGQNVIFDPEQSLSLEGDSGPYLQYALVRAKKILSYANAEGMGQETPSSPYEIERLLMRFPQVCKEALEEQAPQKVAHYLTKLASAWNSFYASEQVLGSPEEAYKQRVARAFANTMTRGLWLLGIPTPERM